jgi:hypothetical protein
VEAVNRWFAYCMGAGFCLGIAVVLTAAGEMLVAAPFGVVGGIFTGRALKEDGV